MAFPIPQSERPPRTKPEPRTRGAIRHLAASLLALTLLLTAGAHRSTAATDNPTQADATTQSERRAETASVASEITMLAALATPTLLASTLVISVILTAPRFRRIARLDTE